MNYVSRAKFVASGVCSTVFSANPVTKLSLACVAGEIRERATFSLFQALGSWGRAKTNEKKNEGGLRRGAA